MSFVSAFEKVSYTKPELKEMIKEHKKLLGVFSRNSRKEEMHEAAKQSKELAAYIKQLDKTAAGFVTSALKATDSNLRSTRRMFAEEIAKARKLGKRGKPSEPITAFTGPGTTDILSVKVPPRGQPKLASVLSELNKTAVTQGYVARKLLGGAMGRISNTERKIRYVMGVKNPETIGKMSEMKVQKKIFDKWNQKQILNKATDVHAETHVRKLPEENRQELKTLVKDMSKMRKQSPEILAKLKSPSSDKPQTMSFFQSA